MKMHVEVWRTTGSRAETSGIHEVEEDTKPAQDGDSHDEPNWSLPLYPNKHEQAEEPDVHRDAARHCQLLGLVEVAADEGRPESNDDQRDEHEEDCAGVHGVHSLP